MNTTVTHADLEAYLDEALAPAVMASIEAELRHNDDLAQQLAAIVARRDAGVHSLGEVWRRNRTSCPAREELGNYLLGTLEKAAASYVQFHVEQVGCRVCAANLDDMRQRQQEAERQVSGRRKKYFQTSAGLLRGKS
jgi:hypothetical protein